MTRNEIDTSNEESTEGRNFRRSNGREEGKPFSRRTVVGPEKNYNFRADRLAQWLAKVD